MATARIVRVEAPADILCRYYAQTGMCGKGDRCFYRHGDDDPRHACTYCFHVRVRPSFLRCARCYRAHREQVAASRLPCNLPCLGPEDCSRGDACKYLHGPHDERAICYTCASVRVAPGYTSCARCRRSSSRPVVCGKCGREKHDLGTGELVCVHQSLRPCNVPGCTRYTGRVTCGVCYHKQARVHRYGDDE